MQWPFVAMLLVCSLGGCTGPTQDVPGVSLVERGTCPELAVDCVMDMLDGETRLTLRNLELQATASTRNVGLRLTNASHVVLDGFSIVGFGTGIDWAHGCDGCSIELRNGRLDATGVQVTGMGFNMAHLDAGLQGGRITLYNVTISGYPHALSIGSYGGEEVLLEALHVSGGEVIVGGGGSVTIRDSQSDGACGRGPEAFHLWTVEVVLERVRVAGACNIGLLIEADQVTAQQLNVTGSGLIGARISASQVQITNSSFTANGHRPTKYGYAAALSFPSPRMNPAAPADTIEIHGCIFAGNPIWEISSTGPVSASGNYWGDPNGPRVRPHTPDGAPALGLGAGDVVDPNVTFVPWLTAP